MIKKWLLFCLRYLPPLFLLLAALQILYGLVFPWKEAEATLALHHEYTPLLIGASSHYSYASGAERQIEENYYLLVGSGISDSKTLVVSVDSVKGFSSSLSDGGLVAFVFTQLALFVLIWFSWVGYKLFPSIFGRAD